MDAELVKILVAVISGAFGIVGTWLAIRAKRSSDSIEAKAQKEASILEGYDEWTLHLSRRVTELETSLRHRDRELRECHREKLEHRGELLSVTYERDHLRRELARYRRPGDPPNPEGARP